MPSDSEWEGLPAPKWNNPPRPPKTQRTKKGNIGKGNQAASSDAEALGWDSAGEMAAQQQNEGLQVVRPAWQQNILSGGTLNTTRNGQPYTLPAWTPPNYGTGSFFAGGGNVVRMGEATGGARVVDASKGTRWVRTGNGTWTAVPLQPGMLTGSFFSGGSPPPASTLPLYPTGTFFGGGGTVVRGPGIDRPLVVTTGGGGGGYTTGGGYGGGRGGGGGGYPARVPSWLMNLHNWNFKG